MIQTVPFGDDTTGYILIDLESVQTTRILEAREIVAAKKADNLGMGKKDS